MDVLKTYFDVGAKASTEVHRKLSEKVRGNIKVYVHAGKLNIDINKSGVFNFKYVDDKFLSRVKFEDDIPGYVDAICGEALTKYEVVSRAFFFKP